MGTFPPRPISGLQLNSDKRAEVETLELSHTAARPACSGPIPSTQEAEAGGSAVQGWAQLQGFKASLGYRRPCSPRTKNEVSMFYDVLGTSPTTRQLDHQCLSGKDPPHFISTGHWSHGLLTQPGQEPSHLQQGVHTFRHFHVSVSNLLDEFQFQIFGHRKGFTHSENVPDDVLW